MSKTDLYSTTMIDCVLSPAPSSLFVTMPTDIPPNHNIYLSIDLTATKDLNKIIQIEQKIKEIDELICNYYSRRSILKPIQKYIQDNPKDKIQIIKIALDQMKPVINFISISNKTITECIKFINTLFNDQEAWSKGYYSDDLLFLICKLIFHIFAFGQLKVNQKSILKDFEIVKDFCSITHVPESTFLSNEIQEWINYDKLIEKKCAEIFKPTAAEIIEQVTSIFYSYILKTLTNPDYMPLLPQDDSIYRVSLSFFINLCPHIIPQSDSIKLYSIFAEVPFLPLICENYFNMLNFIQNLAYFKNLPKPPSSKSNEKYKKPFIQNIKNNFADISFKLWQICSSVNSSQSLSNFKYSPEDIIQIISEAINLISTTTNMLREQYAQKLSDPPPEPKTMTKYERSIRYGYQNQSSSSSSSKREKKGVNEMKTMLQLLALCKQLHDFMQTNLSFLYERICESINYIFDDFITNGLDYIIKHEKHEKKSIEAFIEKIRSLYNNYKGNKETQLTPQSSGPQTPVPSPRKSFIRERKSDEKKSRSVQRSSLRIDSPLDSPGKIRRKTLHLSAVPSDINEEINLSSENLKKESIATSYEEIFTRLAKSENDSLQSPMKQICDPNQKIKKSLVAPPIELIKLVRIQISQVLKPENDFQSQLSGKVRKPRSCFGEKAEKKLNDFLIQSESWVTLLQIESSLRESSDQSCFYFKEVQLDLNNVVQFSVRASLPFILSQFALDNCYKDSEITEIILYPLSIYDDAAYAALNYFKNQMLFDEIRAEAQIALSTITVLVSELAFNTMIGLSIFKVLPRDVLKKLKKSDNNNNNDNEMTKSQTKQILSLSSKLNLQVNHLNALFSQNKFCLLSKHIDLRRSIAKNIDKEINNFVEKLFFLANDFGVGASIAIERGLSVVKEAHKMFTEQEMSLMPLNDIIDDKMRSKDFTSFNSMYASTVIYHMTSTMISKYSLAVNPLRLIQPKGNKLPTDLLGKDAYGKIFKDSLDKTVSFVTSYHFSSFLARIPDGSFIQVAKSLLSSIEMNFKVMVNYFYHARMRLVRIQDAPYGTSYSEAFQLYEGAYEVFLNDKDVVTLIKMMQTIGNTIAVADMLDQSMTSKEFKEVKLVNFLRNIDEETGNVNDKANSIDQLFDKQFQEEVKFISNFPNSIQKQSHHLLLNLTFQSLFNMMNEECRNILNGVVDESQKKHLEYDDDDERVAKEEAERRNHSFAAIWSVLEFIFCLMETMRDRENIDGFMKYGHGVLLSAAFLLKTLDQVNLASFFCIGKRIHRHKITGALTMEDDNINRFLMISKYELSVIDWAYMYFQPLLKNIV